MTSLFAIAFLGATINASTCSQADVSSALSSAVTGDTVTIPSGTCAWTSGVSVSGKAITITGAGAGRIIAYSASSVAIGTGSKTFTIQAGLSISGGQTLRISENGARGSYMEGTVSSYSSTTLTMSIATTAGSGTKKRWLVSTVPSTVITNNSSSTLFALSESTAGHVRLSGIKIAQGSGGGRGVSFNRVTSGQAIVLSNCWIEQGDGDSVWSDTNRGLVTSCSFDSSSFSLAPLAVHLQPDGVTTSWTSASTMGDADTTGESNFYVENSDFHAYLNSADVDNNSRSVFRYNLYNNAGFGTHGPDTSNYGQRHFEFYSNTGVFNGYSDGTTFPMNWWFFIRGGTFVIANNVLPAVDSTDYPNKPDLNVTVMNLQRNSGPNPCWGQGTSGGARYHSPRQAGFGRVTGTGTDGLGRSTDSITYVGDSEPGYIWGNSRSGGSTTALNVGTSDFGECTSPDNTANYFVSGRDYFNSASTAKSGWTAYTYPHPLTSTGAGPAAPTKSVCAQGMQILCR